MKRYVSLPETAMWAHVGSVLVDKNGERTALNPRFDLRNHSPTGFAWGYQGSGPAQLALAILADAAGDEIAERYYQRFKVEVIALLPQTAAWEIEEAEVLRWLLKKTLR